MMLPFYTALAKNLNPPKSFGFLGNRYHWFRLCVLRAAPAVPDAAFDEQAIKEKYERKQHSGLASGR